jgi:predicted NBD/HSP70 family sugar kinase
MSSLVTAAPSAKLILGIDLGGTFVKLGIVTATGSVVRARKAPLTDK